MAKGGITLIGSDKKFPRPHWNDWLDDSMRDSCIALLALEVDRAQHNVFLIPRVCKASENYRADMAQSVRALRIMRHCKWAVCGVPDIALLGLMLLGHRLAIEHSLSVDGLEALAVIASDRLGLPSAEVEAWSEETLFWQFMETALRDEWDYPGIQFRMSMTPPLEAV